MSDLEESIEPGLLRRTAQRCSSRPEFLGYWLDLFRETEGLDLPALARHLGCPVERLDEMALCRRPLPERRTEGVNRLAARFGLDRKRLASLLLLAEAYAARPARVEGEAEISAGWTAPVFAAASDRVSEPAVPGDDRPTANQTDAAADRDGSGEHKDG